MSIMSDLVDAIAAELDAAPETFSQAFAAETLTDPERELEELQELRVDVLKGSKVTEAISRSVLQGDYTIEIVVRQKADGDPDELVRDLESLVEQIDQFFSLPPRRLTAYPAAAWKQSKLVYCYSVKMVRQRRQFTGLLQLTYTVFEKPS